MKTSNLNLAFSNGILMNSPFAWMKIAKVPGTMNNRAGFVSAYFTDLIPPVKASASITGPTILSNASVRAIYMT